MNRSKIWLDATRPKTLSAAIAPVLLGTAMSFKAESIEPLPALICLGFALLVQIGTNLANDYLDGIKGTDTELRIGPRRAVASGLVAPDTMKYVAIGVLTVSFFLGLSLIAFGGWWLLVVGFSSVACAWLYTGGPYPLAYNGLGDIFVILFFGIIAVSCTYYVQVGEITLDVVLLGLSIGLIVNNILLVNNYRDFEEDRKASKRTLVVLFGRHMAERQYVGSLLIAGAVLGWLALKSYGLYILLGWLPLLWGFTHVGKLANADGSEAYLVSLKSAVLVVVFYSFLVSVGLVLST